MADHVRSCAASLLLFELIKHHVFPWIAIPRQRSKFLSRRRTAQPLDADLVGVDLNPLRRTEVVAAVAGLDRDRAGA
jgi:hypothetical protein